MMQPLESAMEEDSDDSDIELTGMVDETIDEDEYGDEPRRMKILMTWVILSEILRRWHVVESIARLFYKGPKPLIGPSSISACTVSTDAHLMAVGFDEDSPTVAQERARQRVAQRVSSTISTQQNSMNAVSQVNGVESVEKRLEEQAQVTASFDFYNLITDIGAPHRAKDGYRALACLSLDEWEQEVLQITQTERESLQNQAQTLSQTSDVFVFGNSAS